MKSDTALDEHESEKVVSDNEETNEEKFENACMEQIEEIVSSDRKLDRLGAIDVSKSKLDNAEASGDTHKIAILKRVVLEFEIATDKEYNLLKKTLFGGQ